MSLKLRQFYLKFLKVNLPFSSKKFIGEDLKGNYYYEEAFSEGYPRRTVKILDPLVKSDLSSLANAPLPVQWISWMRHTRHHPPTIEELMNDEIRKQRTLENVKKLELLQKQEKEQKLLDNGEQVESVKETAEPEHKESKLPQTAKPEEFEPESWSPVARQK
ncbi:hypothetical protein CONCODRAFT_16219 [Conidiobolus coronatus NRRL 28638]|uniref:NADH dehydrogenase [ubiquinone] 1 alpha subcomplex subunit n=1 Tax=Conidiobolus coronatus (strain ATCC 28846 / CBS 209.66 / NRRL 28638) TaxID=796925 RepID=A0A137PBJ7_CONC2|nr:hypothetical protein CONCODRAFT_16219 [Conidiobolus coronatus NRRL 28638]|eukprot:KXN72379.1 hypothetical protein CONCODRAFT_16219 [Conidiobolus coronatus NRRL 28638]